MKLALIFLSIFVAVSHQQYHLGRIFGFPWQSPFAQHLAPVHYFNQYLPVDNRQLYYDDYPPTVQSGMNYQANDLGNQYVMADKSSFNNVQPRIKGFNNYHQPPSQQENARFIYNSGGTNTVNPLLKTVTFTITSTCTAITFTSCIPSASFLAAVQMNPPSCRKKRQSLESQPLDETDQFPVNPSRVQLVMPTPAAEASFERHPRRTGFDLGSSLLENNINDQPARSETEQVAKEQLRKGRFHYFWQSFTTATTTTTWSVTSSLLTQTYNPNVMAGMELPCLPPGYFVCPINGK